MSQPRKTNISKILVATDFSGRSQPALERAGGIAKRCGASLVLCHAIDDEDRPEHMLSAETQIAESALEEARKALAETYGIDCASRLDYGDPHEKILSFAEKEQADLIVIGSHRRRPLKDIFVGTTAERMIRASGRPVLMVNRAAGNKYASALIALDFSPGSAAAIAIVDKLGVPVSGISAVHVYSAPGLSHMRRAQLDSNEIQTTLSGQSAEAEARAKDYLAANGLVGHGAVAARPNLTSVAAEIDKVARENDVDLIALGTHGRSAVDRFFLGSVATEILSASDRDILVTPPAG